MNLISPVDYSALNSVYRKALQLPFYRALYKQGPEEIANIQEFYGLPVINRSHIPAMEVQAIEDHRSSQVVWTGGTGGHSDTIEWCDEDMEATMPSYDAYLEAASLPLNSYALSAVSGNMSLYGAFNNKLCERRGLHHISVGTSTPGMLDSISRLVEEYQVKVLFSTPQGSVRIARHFANRNSAVRPQLVFTSGAPLAQGMRLYLEKTLCPYVLDHYGCTEAGSCGFSCSRKEGFHVDQRNVIIEIIDPDAQGQGKVIVTSLRNTRQPVIRYFGGDIGSLSMGTCTCGSSVPRVILSHRKAETLFIGGTKVDAHQVDLILSQFQIFLPYQLIYFADEIDAERIELRIMGNGPILSPDDFINKVEDINPALFIKLRSGSLAFAVKNVEDMDVVNGRGDKFPRFTTAKSTPE